MGHTSPETTEAGGSTDGLQGIAVGSDVRLAGGSQFEIWKALPLGFFELMRKKM